MKSDKKASLDPTLIPLNKKSFGLKGIKKIKNYLKNTTESDLLSVNNSFSITIFEEKKNRPNLIAMPSFLIDSHQFLEKVNAKDKKSETSLSSSVDEKCDDSQIIKEIEKTNEKNDISFWMNTTDQTDLIEQVDSSDFSEE